MLKRFEKSIACTIILSLILSMCLNLFVLPSKKAMALDGGGSWQTAIKEMILDGVAYGITDQVYKRLAQKIQDWGMGRTSDSNEPLFVLDWGKFFKDALNLGSAKFIQEFGLTKLCAPFSYTLGEMLGLGTYYIDAPTYPQYAACTLDTVVDNVESFLRNPSISVFGWSSWSQLLRMQNNVVGAFQLADDAKVAAEEAEQAAQDKQTAVSQGAKNETTTTQTDTDACKLNCLQVSLAMGISLETCQANCEKKTIGLAIDTQVKNIGQAISKEMNDALGSDLARIIGANEITSLIGVFFSSILNKAVSGLGLFSSPSNTTTADRNRTQNQNQYGYLSALEPLTTEEKGAVYSQILTGVLKGVQMLSRSTTNCKDENEMMNDMEFGRNTQDIYSAELEALYVGLSQTNLQPNFEILDPPYAPFTVNGYSWGKIPTNKIPSKCQNIIAQTITDPNATCKSIKSGLEPNFSQQCESCLYDEDALNCPPGPFPPFKSGVTISKTTQKAKEDFYNNCNGWYLTAQQRCGDCIKKADSKCNQDDTNLRDECIKQICGNYQDIAPYVISKIADGKDFYNKCLIEEQKNSCFACIKESFIPASYCNTMTDYTARAIIKYPAVVVRVSDDDGHSIGRYDPSFDAAYADANGDIPATECDNDESSKKDIPVDLICRIMPDFKYQGEDVCRKYCFQNPDDPMTEAELTDTTDFRPNSIDCGKETLKIGGEINVNQFINDSIFIAKGKCCATAWQYDSKKYGQCVGSSDEKACTWAKPVSQEPWCYCDEGDRPLAFARTGFPRSTGLGGDCNDATFSGDKALNHSVYGYTNAGAWTQDYAYVSATNSCSETDELWDNTAGRSSEDTTPATYDATHCCTTDSTAPASTICSSKLVNGNNRITCDIGSATGTIHTGVYHTGSGTLGDTKATSWTICTQCDPNDPDYPNYGTGYNQCTGKVK